MRKNNLKQRNFGFTLIELLVVISIISLLASILTTVVHDARIKATSAAAKQQGREAKNAMALAFTSTPKPNQNPFSYQLGDVPEITNNLGGITPAVPASLSNDSSYYFISNGNRAADFVGIDYFCLQSGVVPNLPNTTTDRGIVVWRDNSVTEINSDEFKTLWLPGNEIETFAYSGTNTFYSVVNSDNFAVYDSGLAVFRTGTPPEDPTQVFWIDEENVYHPFICDNV